jgi:carboxypeptidase Q
MPRHVKLLLVVTIVFASLPIHAQSKRGPSTPEERDRAVQVAKSLRTEPLAARNQDDREWLIRWLIEVPDISISFCSNFLGDLGKSKNGYPGAILASMMASQASLVIEQKEKAADLNSVYLAGVNGALDAYLAIQKKDQKFKLKQMDELLQKREKGTLAEYVNTTAKTCKSN